MSAAEETGATYELTVVGALGPVLRMALQPCTAATPQNYTILLASVHDADLADVVRLLDSRGLRIAQVTSLITPQG